MSKLTYPHHSLKFPVATAVLCGLLALQGQGFAADPAKPTDAATVRDEHDAIGVGQQKSSPHTTHPDAQWFPDAGCGLFIHWGLSSVKAMNISWPMIPGRPLAAKRITDPAERERILREGDWNLTGKKPEITPNEYWAMAKDFNPSRYDPDKRLKAAKPLPAGEKSSVPATAAGSTRYLFALPRFKEDGKYPEDLLPASDLTMTLTGVTSPSRVTLSASGKDLPYHHSGTTLTIQLPATLRTPLVDVVEVLLANSAERNHSKTPH